ncbi:MAG: alanine:cation symporter family protein [Bdellovibrionales bacterium]
MQGEVQGGPMYVIKSTLSKKWVPLAYLFAFAGMMGTLPLFNMNQLSSFMQAEYNFPPMVLGLGCATVVGFILIGGVRSIGAWTSRIVPIMCVFYVVIAATVVGMNIEKVPDVFRMIFSYALTGQAAWGGATGLAVSQILIVGVKRAAFSNEAGVGTAPMAHSNAKTEEPIAEGLVSMVGPFIDTIIVCTLTALVILTTLPLETIPEGAEGVLITKLAFEQNFGSFGNHFLSVAVALFAFSTILGTANYCQKCWNFLFRGKFKMGNHAFIGAYALLLVIGSVTQASDVVNFLDICFATMALPNMLITIRLANRVRGALKVYWAKYKVA